MLQHKVSDLDRKNNDENRSSNSTSSSSTDLHICIKGVSFHLYKELLAKRSSKVSSFLERNEIDKLRWILRDLDAEPESFEVVARFCYGYEVKFSSDTIVSVLCIAYYLGMNEQQSTSNLLGKASEFLEQRVLPVWNETVVALRSGDKSFDKLNDIELVDLFFDSLIDKASYDPRLLGELIKNVDDNDTDDYRPNPRRRLFDIDWKSEDLITLPLRLYESFMIRALNSQRIPLEYIVLSVCKYAKKWVFDAEESVSGEKREAIEAVERLIPHERGLISCEMLFESLKHSILLEASPECRNGFLIRISKQLDIAKPTELEILSRGYEEKGETFQDTELVKTVIKSFYSNYTDKHSEDVTRRFVKVAKLMEEFLFLAASEGSLKLEAFVELAEMTVTISEAVLSYSDGIYRAIDVFLETHGYLTESEKMEACKVLECSKLSQQGCEEAAKNQRLPLRIVVQVLFVSQLLIRDTVTKEINKGIEEKVNEEEECKSVSSVEDEMSIKLLGLEIETKTKKTKKKKISVWREVKRKFGCLTSSSSVDACTCDYLKKKKKKKHNHYK